MDKLFEPESIVVIASTKKKGRKHGLGHDFRYNLKNPPFGGKVYFVNKRGGWMGLKKVHKTISDIGEKIDLAIIAVPGEQVPAVCKECKENGVGAGIIISDNVPEFEIDWPFVGPNCVGTMNIEHWMNASMIQSPEYLGSTSIITQSGSIGHIIRGYLDKRDKGINKLVSVGNEAKLDASQFVDYFSRDDSTKSIVMYIEGVKNGRGLMHAIEKSEKPVFIIKGGETKSGSMAVMSHTSAVAGNKRIFEGAMKQCGAILVDESKNLADSSQKRRGGQSNYQLSGFFAEKGSCHNNHPEKSQY